MDNGFTLGPEGHIQSMDIHANIRKRNRKIEIIVLSRKTLTI